MVLNMSVCLILHHTVLNMIFFENHHIIIVCFLTRLLVDYFGLVYSVLISAMAVDMFVKVVLVFDKINHFPLKAAIVAWSKSCSLYSNKLTLSHFF